MGQSAMGQSGAAAALSSRVVLVDAQSCPSEAGDQIQLCQATHAVVFQAGRFLGLIRLDDIVDLFTRRSFAELLRPGSRVVIPGDLSLEELVQRFAERDLDAAII